MSSNLEKSVKGGTKVKLAPPKTKYVEHILLATQTEAGVAEVFRTLTHRLRDSTWTVAFKSLIIVHLMIKEGAPETTLNYLAVAPKARLAINTFTDVQTQGQNIRRYSEYLLARAQAYAATKFDHVRNGDIKMRRMTVEKGLLRETEVVQDQIRALVRCDLFSNDAENEISLTAFRLLTRDLLDLYNVQNEAVMNVLSHYFEMSKPDAERAIKIYKRFCKQTDQVVQYLSVARQYEHATRLEIPKIKHAPTSLANSLQEYLDDADFDINRRQYLAEQEAKRTGKPVPKRENSAKAQPPNTSSASQVAPAAQPPPQKGPDPDLIDFFESIEQNQQTMAQSVAQVQQQPAGFQQSQMTGFPVQQPQQPFGFQQGQLPGINGISGGAVSTNPFGQPQQQLYSQPQPQQPPPIQTHFTGAGFGGFSPPQQQQPFATPMQKQSPVQLQPQQTGSTNPFRQSMMPSGTGFGQQNAQRQGTNPFARSSPLPAVDENGFTQMQSPSVLSPQQETASFSPMQQQPLQSQPTGTNPFARNFSPTQPTASTLQVQATGSTNPFRQSAFVNQQTGQGWQTTPQATMGGLENLDTIPVFPRPGQMQSQPQQQQSPWG